MGSRLILTSLLLASLAMTAGAARAEMREIVSEDGVFRLGAIFDTAAMPAEIRQRAEGLVLADFVAGRGDLIVAERQLATRARRLMPVLARWLAADSGQSVILRSAAPQTAQRQAIRSAHCRTLRSTVDAGAPVTSGNFETLAVADGDCTNDALRFDGSGLRARREIAAGETIAVAPGLLADVAPGDSLIASTRIGYVRVRRDMIALQPGRAGRRVFARGADGGVLALTLEGEE